MKCEILKLINRQSLDCILSSKSNQQSRMKWTVFLWLRRYIVHVDLHFPFALTFYYYTNLAVAATAVVGSSKTIFFFSPKKKKQNRNYSKVKMSLFSMLRETQKKKKYNFNFSVLYTASGCIPSVRKKNALNWNATTKKICQMKQLKKKT